jgi:hypothetical protein
MSKHGTKVFFLRCSAEKNEIINFDIIKQFPIIFIDILFKYIVA